MLGTRYGTYNNQVYFLLQAAKPKRRVRSWTSSNWMFTSPSYWVLISKRTGNSLHFIRLRSSKWVLPLKCTCCCLFLSKNFPYVQNVVFDTKPSLLQYHSNQLRIWVCFLWIWIRIPDFVAIRIQSQIRIQVCFPIRIWIRIQVKKQLFQRHKQTFWGKFLFSSKKVGIFTGYFYMNFW